MCQKKYNTLHWQTERIGTESIKLTEFPIQHLHHLMIRIIYKPDIENNCKKIAVHFMFVFHVPETNGEDEEGESTFIGGWCRMADERQL